MGELLTAFAKGLFLVPLTLLPIINPVGVAPIYLSLLGRVDQATNRYVAQRVGINAIFVLLVAMFGGAQLLGFFGISLPIVRVAGGLIVAATAWSLLSDPNADSATEDVGHAERSSTDVLRNSFYPLTFPFTVGPGSIAAAITLGAALSARRATFNTQLASHVGMGLGVVLTASVIYLCYRYAPQLVRALGSVGTTVLLRFSAFILLCVGVQIVWDGVADLVLELSREMAH